MSADFCDDDAAAEQALIMCENGIHASSVHITGSAVDDCMDCGEAIEPARVAFARSKGMKCHFCIECQPKYDNIQKIKMLTQML